MEKSSCRAGNVRVEKSGCRAGGLRTEKSGCRSQIRTEVEMRILGLDHGSKTVGVAVSDALQITAQGVETIVREKEDKLQIGRAHV